MNPYMEEAVREARRGIRHGDGGPFGCVIVRDGKIVGRGHNEVVARNDPTCHGEILAIRDACASLGTYDLSGCELYTTGEPCPMCLGAILWANIGKVYFGCTVADTASIGFRDETFYRTAGDRGKLCVPCEREACLRLYEEYRNLEGKVSY